MIELLHWLIGSPRMTVSLSWKLREIWWRIRYYFRSFYRCSECGCRWNGCWVGAQYWAAKDDCREIEGNCRTCANKHRLQPI